VLRGEHLSEELTAIVDEPFTIAVSDGLGGYQWSPRALPDGVRLIADEVVASAAPEATPGQVGTAQPRQFTFVADRPGDYRVELELKRSWEDEALRTRAVDVRVAGSGG
jgi:predicted secreted protein